MGGREGVLGCTKAEQIKKGYTGKTPTSGFDGVAKD